MGGICFLAFGIRSSLLILSNPHSHSQGVHAVGIELTDLACTEQGSTSELHSEPHYFYLETVSHQVVQAGLELTV